MIVNVHRVRKLLVAIGAEAFHLFRASLGNGAALAHARLALVSAVNAPETSCDP